METILIVILVIICGVADFFIYLKIKEQFSNRSHMSKEEFKKVSEKYENLLEEVKKLKKTMQEYEKKYVKLKNKEVDKIEEKKSRKPNEVEILLSEKLVSSEDIKKAKEFIKNNDSSFSILDALILLGKLDERKSELVRSKMSGES